MRLVSIEECEVTIAQDMVADIPENRHPRLYMESLQRRMARLSGEEGPPAA